MKVWCECTYLISNIFLCVFFSDFSFLVDECLHVFFFCTDHVGKWPMNEKYCRKMFDICESKLPDPMQGFINPIMPTTMPTKKPDPYPSPTKGPFHCPEICSAVYEPVCGSDMKTYGNNCELEREACKKSLNKIHDGECKSTLSNDTESEMKNDPKSKI